METLLGAGLTALQFSLSPSWFSFFLLLSPLSSSFLYISLLRLPFSPSSFFLFCQRQRETVLVMVLKRPALSLFKLGTFNVRGLTSNIKQQHSAADMDSYGVDFCSLQELKTTQAFDQLISNGGIASRLISFGQNSGKRGGLRFVMSPRVGIFLVQHKRLSDRQQLCRLQVSASS